MRNVAEYDRGLCLSQMVRWNEEKGAEVVARLREGNLDDSRKGIADVFGAKDEAFEKDDVAE